MIRCWLTRLPRWRCGSDLRGQRSHGRGHDQTVRDHPARHRPARRPARLPGPGRHRAGRQGRRQPAGGRVLSRLPGGVRRNAADHVCVQRRARLGELVAERRRVRAAARPDADPARYSSGTVRLRGQPAHAAGGQRPGISRCGRHRLLPAGRRRPPGRGVGRGPGRGGVRAGDPALPDDDRGVAGAAVPLRRVLWHLAGGRAGAPAAEPGRRLQRRDHAVPRC